LLGLERSDLPTYVSCVAMVVVVMRLSKSQRANADAVRALDDLSIMRTPRVRTMVVLFECFFADYFGSGVDGWRRDVDYFCGCWRGIFDVGRRAALFDYFAVGFIIFWSRVRVSIS
jgi:hypothetical protein